MGKYYVCINEDTALEVKKRVKEELEELTGNADHARNLVHLYDELLQICADIDKQKEYSNT